MRISELLIGEWGKWRSCVSLMLPLIIGLFISESMCVTVTIPLHLTRLSSSNFQTADSLHEHYYDVDGRPGEGYFITVDIGTPPQKLNVLIDTGSSNFAIASRPDPLIDTYFYTNRSSTFQSKNVSIIVPYTLGSWKGYLASDFIQLQGLPPVRSDIACITQADHFFINGSEWQGILGLGFADIARPPGMTVPLFDTLVKVPVISNVFSLQLCGEQKADGKSAGTLVLGGVDRKLHRDHIRYTPLHRAWYFEVVLTSLSVGKEVLDVDCKELNNDKTIVDSGTTNLRLPDLVFTKIVKSLTKQIKLEQEIPEEFWTGSKFMCWAHHSHSLHSFPELRLSLAHSINSTFTLVITPKQYLRPVPEVDGENGNNTSCYKFAITPSTTGTVIGAVIMEGFYVVFDRQNRRIGFAKSVCNAQTYKNDFGPEIEGPFPHKDPWSCVYQNKQIKTLQIVSYVLSALAIVCTLPLVVLLVQWIIHRWKHRKLSRLVDTNSVIGE